MDCEQPKGLGAEPPEAVLGPLLVQLRGAVFNALEKKLAPLELTAAQFGVVVNLARGRAETPGELCRLMDYDRGAMTRLLDRIEGKEIIQRIRCRDDRRSVKLRLTEKGAGLVPQVMPLVYEVYRNGLKDFSISERDRLLEDLRKLLDAL
ncbi:MAG: MarR family transcriptional regulator [Gammaproteobacteria bacterium]|nr:MarR family transcriptional regulator [Gammaproteobacteria bacterium]